MESYELHLHLKAVFNLAPRSALAFIVHLLSYSWLHSCISLCSWEDGPRPSQLVAILSLPLLLGGNRMLSQALLFAPGHAYGDGWKHSCRQVGVKRCCLEPLPMANSSSDNWRSTCHPRTPALRTPTHVRVWRWLASVGVTTWDGGKLSFRCARLPSTTFWYHSTYIKRAECW